MSYFDREAFAFVARTPATGDEPSVPPPEKLQRMRPVARPAPLPLTQSEE